MVHQLHGRLAISCLPVFTSDGLNLSFSALTAHFGQWVAGVGRGARQWQVAAGLIYGQVKKRYQRRKLVRVTQVMRYGTRERLKTALRELGLSGRLNSACVERLKEDAATKPGGAHRPDLVDDAGCATAAGPAGMVAGLLSLRRSTRVVTGGAGTANRARRQAPAPALPPTDTRAGGRPDESSVDGS